MMDEITYQLHDQSSVTTLMHNGLKVVFWFMHAIPSHYHHYADLLT